MQSATEALHDAGQFGPSIWFAALVFLTGAILLVLYVKFVTLPSQKSQEENSKKLTEVVSKLADVMTRTDARTAQTHEAVGDVRVVINAIAAAKSSEVDAIAKVARKAGVDIQSELAEVRGLMKYIRAEHKAEASA